MSLIALHLISGAERVSFQTEAETACDMGLLTHDRMISTNLSILFNTVFIDMPRLIYCRMPPQGCH